MRPLQKPTYRLYNCRHCGALVEICTRCDHGNIYCSVTRYRPRRHAEAYLRLRTLQGEQGKVDWLILEK
jgi:hypothetical protein